MDDSKNSQNARYLQASAAFGPALERLARAYEADPEKRRDLLQDIHFALWRSMAGFAEQCSVRTWVYRVAHNCAASHVLQQLRRKPAAHVSLDELELADDGADPEQALDTQQRLSRLVTMIRALKAPDAQVMMLYLENLDAAAIGEITGLSPGAVATKIHRIKVILARKFREKERAS